MPKPKTIKKEIEEAETARKVVSKVSGEPPLTPKLANLPLVSAVFNTTEEMKNCIDLLGKAINHKSQIEALENTLEGEKLELTAICRGAEVPGFRYGRQCVMVDEVTSERLDKDRLRGVLIDLGVNPTQLAEAFKECSKPSTYYRVTLKTIE